MSSAISDESSFVEVVRLNIPEIRLSIDLLFLGSGFGSGLSLGSGFGSGLSSGSGSGFCASDNNFS